MSAQEHSDYPIEEAKKYDLSICAIFKNEAAYLKEWIEYHRLVGIDHFYLYNIGSTDHFMEVLGPYIKKNVVTLIHWSDHMGCQEEDNAFKWALGTQVPAYENAIKFRTKETKWLVFVDIDEFLVSPNANKLTEVLEKYEEHPGIILASDFFDASQIDAFSRRKLLIETLELANAPRKNPQKEVSKTIFKPDLCHGFTWPPYKCIFKDRRTAITIRKPELRINNYINRNVGYFFTKAKDKLHIDNRFLTDDEISELLALDYEIEDQDRVIYHFVPELRKKMGYEPIWNW
jgi:hypothetical protein